MRTSLQDRTVLVVGPILLSKHLAPRLPEDGSFVLFSGSSARKPMAGMLAVGAPTAPSTSANPSSERTRPMTDIIVVTPSLGPGAADLPAVAQ